jgi:plasmid stabilization system protein ParE
MRVEWTDGARLDFLEAIRFIAEDNPPAAQRIRDRIVEALERLTVFPRAGRPGRVVGTRELPIVGTPFIAVYAVEADMVRILLLLHGARRYP